MNYIKLFMQFITFFPSENMLWEEARREENVCYTVQYTNTEMRLNYR